MGHDPAQLGSVPAVLLRRGRDNRAIYSGDNVAVRVESFNFLGSFPPGKFKLIYSPATVMKFYQSRN